MSVACTRADHPGADHVPDELLRVLAEGRPRFLAFARRRVRSSADAEDVLQEALVKASSRLGDLRDCAALEGWFFRVLRRAIFDHLARGASETRKREALAALGDTDAPEAPRDTCACSLSELGRMPAAYREILQRVDLEESSLTDAAEALGVTPNNAGVRLHRARRALREALSARCGTASAVACLDCGCDDERGTTSGDA